MALTKAQIDTKVDNEIGNLQNPKIRGSILNEILKDIVLFVYELFQVKLLSGSNIRPVQGESLLGSENLVIDPNKFPGFFSDLKTGPVEQPDDFDHPMGPFVVERHIGQLAVLKNVSAETFRFNYVAPIEKYMDAINGDDSNDGNSWATAYKTQSKLRNPANPFDRAYFKSGTYAFTSNNIFDANKEFIAVEPGVYFGLGRPANELTWTPTLGGAYSTPYTQNPSVFWDTSSPDYLGRVSTYTNVGSVGAVQSTPGTWYKDTTLNILHVHAEDSASPNRNTLMAGGGQISFFANGISIYCEGIIFLKGINGETNSSDQNTLLTKSCAFFHNNAPGLQNVNIKGNIRAVFDHCRWRDSGADGIDYDTVVGGYLFQAIEINCDGADAGLSGTGAENDNATTAHGEGWIFRIGGNYQSSRGPAVHDVGAVKFWNVDCMAGNSTALLAGGRKLAFAFASTNEGWYDGCSAINGETVAIGDPTGSGSETNVRNCNFPTTANGVILNEY